MHELCEFILQKLNFRKAQAHTVGNIYIYYLKLYYFMNIASSIAIAKVW